MPKPDDVGVGVCVFIVNEHNEVLLGRRKGAHRAGHFCSPGGWVDREDDDLLDAVRRETLEEVGLQIERAELLHATTEDHPEIGVRTVTLYYVVWPGDWSGVPELREPHKCEGWAWHAIEDPPSPLYPKMEGALEDLELLTAYHRTGEL